MTCALIAAALVAAMATGAAADAGERPRPDLVVKSGQITYPNDPDVQYVVGHGQNSDYMWKQKTTNKGKAIAPRSKTGVQIVIDRNHVFSPPGARVNVPRLAPGKSHATRDAFEMEWDQAWDYGTYPTRICADVTRKVSESKEGKNCRATHNFYVAPFGFEGTVSGEAVQPLVMPGVTLTWEFSDGVAFEIDPRVDQPFADDGIIEYAFVDPRPDVSDLHYEISGTNTLDGCVWQGMGAYEPATEFHTIQLSFFRPAGRVHAQILVDRGAPFFSFAATATCPGGGSIEEDIIPSEWGRAAYWLDFGANTRFPDPGLTQIKGDYTDSNATYHWDLTPYDVQ